MNPLDPEDRSWSDSRLRSEFNTLQIFDQNGNPTVRVSRAFGDKKGAELEHFTSAYPELGKGAPSSYMPMVSQLSMTKLIFFQRNKLCQIEKITLVMKR